MAIVSIAAIAYIINRVFKQDHCKVENTDDHFKISCTSPISVKDKKFDFNSSEIFEYLDSYQMQMVDTDNE